MSDSRAQSELDSLRAFLWGKRHARRHALAVDVEVRGALGVVSAMSIDVSAGGVLLRIPTAAVAPEAAADGDVDPLVLIQTHFRTACKAEFKRCHVKAHIEVVRLDFRADQPGFLYVGFRFSRPLDPEQLRRLGLAPEECESELHALPSEMMPLRAADDPIVGRICDANGTNETMFEGFVLGVGDGTLCLRVCDGDAALAAVDLRSKDFRVEVLDEDRVEWEAGAQLKAIGFPDDDPRALELGLAVDAPLAQALKQRFVPAEAAAD